MLEKFKDTLSSNLDLVGLNPATNHTVKIQGKNLTGKFENNIRPEKLTSQVEFQTAVGGVYFLKSS